jgi:hypothetical protein
MKDRDAARSTGAANPHPGATTTRAGWAALALLALACGGPDAHNEAAALRADSSAAGYDVGPVASAATDTPAMSRGTQPANGQTPAGSIGPRDTTGSRANASPDSTAVKAGANTPVKTPAETAVPPRDTVRPILIARTRVNEYLEYNRNSRTVYIDVVATRAATVDSTSVAGDTLSFNGSQNGQHSVTVPLGWNVVGQFVNRDPVQAHSAIVIEEAYPLPTVPPPAAFPQAFTRGVEDGLAHNARDEITFIANREGRYLIVCGVPGHAEGGQRIQLVVTSEVNVPAYGR